MYGDRPVNALTRYIKNHLILASVAAIIALSAGGSIAHYAAQALASDNPDSAAPQAPAVDIMIVHPKEVRIWSDFSGRLVAVDDVDIRPRVGGTITDILFDDCCTFRMLVS